MADDPDRRKFLKVTSCAIGGGVGLAVGIPALRLVTDPATKTTVTAPSDPFDVGALDRFRVGAEPRKIELIASRVQDGWTTARDVVIGAAWIRRVEPAKVEAFSAVCPHLGCAVGWTDGKFLCPCHDSLFAINGQRETGPSERDLDPLPVQIKDGRLQLTWVRYRVGGATREPA
ncbi:MAG TPA: Rieske 2Fe-2S domain-containing protein [Kofleriaceae bacterium]|jgi:Rieske Fe-S protein|nr:Rieske 2Fe-2S domain-containing protein [Kofleriaceae bacterium]